jgi:hypothetical protein
MEPVSQKRVLTGMSRPVFIAIYVLAMVAVIVGVDFAFLRGLFWQRLLVNAAIVLAFAAFYLMVIRAS